MAGASDIHWTDATWNPVVGCSILSPGCAGCYAMRMARRLDGLIPHYAGTTKVVNGHPVWTSNVAMAPEASLTAPLRWRKPRMVFVNSMSDLFHESIPDEWIDRVLAVMALAPQHTFQVLTKRAERMRAYCSAPLTPNRIGRGTDSISGDRYGNRHGPCAWPLSNVWLGISCERQQEADERIPLLLQTLAAIRFVSCEPLLGAIKLNRINVADLGWQDVLGGWRVCKDYPGRENVLDWVIVGGESGPDARPFDLSWGESIVYRCRAAGVPCFVKQLGAWPMSDGYPMEYNDSKGADCSEWPDNLQVRQFPSTRQAPPSAPVLSENERHQL